MKGALALAVVLLRALALEATEYYVAKTGDDNHRGTVEEPFLTIQKCSEVVRAGDVCVVQSGNYHERVTPPNGGSPGQLVVFRAQGNVVMRGFTLKTGYIRVQGFEISNTPGVFPDYYGVYLQGDGYEVVENTIHHTLRDGVRCAREIPANRSVIRGNVIRYAEGTGITLYGQQNIVEYNDISQTLNASGGDADGVRFFGDGHVIRFNSIHDITEAEAPGAHTDALQTFDNGQPPTTNILIEGNHCYNLDHQMIIISAQTKRQSSGIVIRNNVFESPVNPPGWQLIYVRQVPQVEVVHNTFINARYRAVYLGDNARNAVVKNNIFYNVPRYYEIEPDSREGFRVGSNLHYPDAVPASEPNGIYQDPQFVSPAGGDYRLKETSPAIDRGEELGVTTDKDGEPRPRGRGPDLGAYEFRQEPTPRGQPPGIDDGALE